MFCDSHNREFFARDDCSSANVFEPRRVLYRPPSSTQTYIGMGKETTTALEVSGSFWHD